MKIKFLAAAAAVSVCAMAAAPAFAGDGFVEGDYVNVRPTGGAKSVDGWQGLATFSTMPSSGSWGVQGDLTYGDANHVANEFVSGQVTAYKQTDMGRVGVYGSYQDQFGDNVWEGGATAQLFVGKRWTLSGLVGGGRDTDAEFGYWLAGANATFYVTPNLSVAGDFAHGTYDHGIGGDTIMGAHVEWKPESSPVSFVLGYSNDNFAGGGRMTNFISGGLRFSFGGNQSLQDRDQKGLINDFSLREHL